ncbi:hypothetical protein EGI26_16350 [Lacihabitans sp. CCS-44]|uniref:c-type cytochrome domain-containing protein n=1 Tax=Lacihabitans sp. CCS-44 TaxID=2487331 RepID=UPI0020CD8ECE|nr:c-type cytochrome domain-containing protein [Lacihabitans sp. CCS-44]MCP9756738.1 hypothetical protein [Lacihabitans sp. CCS-44]
MIIDFLGKFHPLLVHLPIGFFVLAFALKVLSFWKNEEAINAILPVMLILSFCASLFSSITGFLLSQSGEYDIEMVNNHQWAGIGFTVFVGGFYILRNNSKLNLPFWGISIILLVVVGHLGGSLTHGEDFLSLSTKPVENKPIADVQKAAVYEEIIKPIFEEKCYSCHSAKKQKGNLRLDSPDSILKGGKNGKTIVPHEIEKSILSQRLFLKDSDEEHMPPKGKTQLSNEELKIINWWIKEGASFDKKANQLNQTTEIKQALLTFQAGNVVAKGISNVPEKDVEKGSEESIVLLKTSGILAITVAANSNYLLVNLRGIDPSAKDIEALKSLKKQVVWFNAANLKNAEGLANLFKELNEIRVLHLNKTNFSDKAMAEISYLSHLQTLNLSHTLVTEKGLEKLKDLKELQKVFLYKSKVKFSLLDFSKFPNIKIDTGGYYVPTFETDTTTVKEVI